MPLPETIRWTAEGVRTLDQSRLPAEEYHELHRTVESLADAISTLRIRGAPLLGVGQLQTLPELCHVQTLLLAVLPFFTE